MSNFRYISATILAVFLALAMTAVPQALNAQSAQNNCTAPDFEITSSSELYALTGESFSYYVVTANDTPYQLASGLPTGLSFSAGQISGTPQTTGDYTISFAASNDCGTTTQSISISVVDSGGAVAQAGDQAAAGSVGLDEIPETGLAADTALTVGFYLLALLLIAGWFTRRLTPAFSEGGGSSVSPLQSTYPDVPERGSFIPSQTTDRPAHYSQPRRFGDGIRRS